MSEQAKKEPPKNPEPAPATAVTKRPDVGAELIASAKTFEERQLAWTLASKIRQNDMLRQAAAAIGETGWGKDISQAARAAVARYCLEVGADPVRHVHVLGGSTVYLNGEFYKELCAVNPKFLRAETDFIHDDDRADEKERERRKGLRVKWGVPEKAPGACLVTLFYADGRGPFEGVNWAGVRDKDPVGKAEPTKTAETRAYRKAAMKAEPAWFRSHPRLAHAEEVLAQGRLAPHEEEQPPAALEPEPVEVKAIAAKSGEGVQEQDRTPSPTQPAPAADVMTKHAPSGLCQIEGEHPESACGYHRKKSAGAES